MYGFWGALNSFPVSINILSGAPVTPNYHEEWHGLFIYAWITVIIEFIKPIYFDKQKE